MKKLLFFLFLFALNNIQAQEKQQSIKFQFTFQGKEIELEKNYFLSSINDSVSIDKIRMYISSFQFLDGDKVVDTTDKKYHLIDYDDPSTLSMNYSADKKFDAIRFNIGIDSLTNVTGAHGGDLDPANGMYWAWQSGYINFKLEGKSKVCKTRNNVFQFHLGGYLPPNNSMQEIKLHFMEGKDVVKIELDKFLAKINLAEENEVMSPGEKAVDLSKKLASIISLE